MINSDLTKGETAKMGIDFPVENTVRRRRSVRTYDERGLSKSEKGQIDAYITGLSNPFSVDVSFRLLETSTAVNGEKLGTYGVIKGARDFIGASVADGELALEALGYSFERLVLYATFLGLGTCWLGGTFNRSGFAAAMGLSEGELFPCISPVGHPKGKKRAMESFIRWMGQADQRKEWHELFFRQGFSQPLTQAEAGEFAYPLEMVRLAPSAVNKQPWRIVQDHGAYHFYAARTLKSDKVKIDLQRVDLGIAACHFHMAALEKGLPGKFQKLVKPEIQSPEQMQYIFSWIVR
ncbi:nitroreductase [Syntrophobotulus glycolicus DSM 8271]|uniref:Nitroreductase n=1 Tax=Syntrophobotulus glycolicus (strain DSM 8271 / FlGlyR) TaxID=645991 RepID=F0SWG9_SYNGF|nr:nitroreductase family protein [Syntrophobotulus glycolicus]ADY55735.1 nitroreductase [Syntrophobotulus glycolicus DSM 8271]